MRLESIEPQPGSSFKFTILVSGFRRIRVEKIIQVSPYIVGHVSEVEKCPDIESKYYLFNTFEIVFGDELVS